MYGTVYVAIPFALHYITAINVIKEFNFNHFTRVKCNQKDHFTRVKRNQKDEFSVDV